MKRSTSGFTLLELLVVVGILAALVALALPFYQDYVNQSKITAAQADLQTYKKALAMYDQLESTPYTTAGDFRPLLGKYLQEFGLNAAQVMPMDPWGNEYKYDVAAGSVWSLGPDGTDGVTGTDKRIVNADADDILVTWKPDFYVAGARKINNRTLEVTFSRKVATLTTGNITTPASCGTVQRVSDTSFRLIWANAFAGTTLTVADTVAAKDGRTLAQSTKPGGTANTVNF